MDGVYYDEKGNLLAIVTDNQKGEKMKKLFVSVPMRDRTEENIRKSIEKMHKIAEATVGEELELIDSYVPENNPEAKDEAIWHLGDAIKKMAIADYVIIPDNNWMHNGCDIEERVARYYGIPIIAAPGEFVAPDVIEKYRNECLTAVPVNG